MADRELGIWLKKKDIEQVLEYIEGYWPRLIRTHKKDYKTLIGLPNPYIVPAETNVFQEQYYWDTYPVVRALINHPKYSDLAIGMVDNFLYLIHRFGIIPNASRFYFLSRSQPPLLSSMIWIVYKKTKNKAWFRKAIGCVEHEYQNVWMGRSPLSNFRQVYRGLSRYYDINAIDALVEAESGWDMTARFGHKCLDFLPVDLNCLLYLYEADLAKAYKVLKDKNKQQKYQRLAKQRARMINDLMWDEKAGYYFDYNFVKRRRSKLTTIAGIYPLNVGIALKPQADRVAHLVQRNFQKKYGIVQSVRFAENYQWDWPNGWAPMQLRTVEGLMRYGYNRLARRVVLKWLALNIKIYKETGRLWEKYDVVHGRIGMPDRYPTPHGFAWTNAVFIILVRFLNFLETQAVENATPL